jgi:hypothetical protein
MSLTLDLSAITSGQVSVATEFGLGDPFTQLDQEMNDYEHNHCSSQNANASSGDQSLSASPIATVSRRETFLE